MKVKVLLWLFWAVFIGGASAQQNTDGFPVLTGPYLGQSSPGTRPEILAPGLISLGYQEHRLAISPDGGEFYFTVMNQKTATMQILYSKLVDGRWSAPAVAPFSNQGMNLHPSFSPGGKRLFFVSTRLSGPDRNVKQGADIWFVERSGQTWSEPVNAGPAVNTEKNESSPTVAADGTLIFESNRDASRRGWDIYASQFHHGAYQAAQKLPAPVNSEYHDGSPFISPDGKLLLFCSDRPGSMGESDLYLAVKDGKGAWLEPRNLGEEVNSTKYDWAPIISPDGRYLVFSSDRVRPPATSAYPAYAEAVKGILGEPKAGNATLYWLDAALIKRIKPGFATQRRR